MKRPIIPFIVAAMLLIIAVYLFTATTPVRRVLDVPKMTRLADIEGTETGVAIAPDGQRYAVISSGDLWLFTVSSGTRQQITNTPEEESFPAWAPDGTRVTFTRGAGTYIWNTKTNAEELFKADATFVSWSGGAIAFVRERALWLADSDGQSEKQIVEADTNPDISIRTPRFGPDSTQLAFIKSVYGLRGEVWIANVRTGESHPLVADRVAENPLDVGWATNGRNLVYLTNRAGAYSLWYVDLANSAIMPLTQPLAGEPLKPAGIAIWQDRVVTPLHFIDSDIVISDGTPIAQSDRIEFEPSVSRDGTLVAYVVENENKFEVWTATITGDDAKFRALGRTPRFSPSGFEIVYTHTDLSGNQDIWRLDIRDGSSERLTDADEMDVTADWSPDGRTVAFSSARGGALSIWTIPTSGGKRLRLNDGGYAPRFSPDGASILFWNKNAMWTMSANGNNAQLRAEGVATPAAGGWTEAGPVVRPNASGLMWPQFDVLPDGRYLISPIEIRETGLWAIDLMYKEYK